MESKSSRIQNCPSCGTRLSAQAKRCIVCGQDLGYSRVEESVSIRGSRMPEVTIGLPAILGLLTLFLSLGAVIVFLVLRGTGRVVEPIPTATPSLTPTHSPTPTRVTPTPTYTPLPTPTPLSYRVVEGDTCAALAGRFEVSINSIIILNGLPASCDLFIGQVLSIPHPTPTSTALPTATLTGLEATLQACDKIYYTVQVDDTLSTIAANYNVPIAAIKSYNGLSSDTVFSGQDLIIPLCERLVPIGPTPTPTKPPPYPPTNLLLPADGAAFSLAHDSITLQWAAVATLRENEAYAVTIVDVTEGRDNRLVVYVTDTKYIVPTTMRPKEATPHVFRWWVQPVRQVGTDENGRPLWDSAGAESEKRVFTWTGAAPAGTPAP
ncbi:MAG: LysM peptidoglycan-binding domain-containing protein [Chloroflexota bacterium]